MQVQIEQVEERADQLERKMEYVLAYNELVDSHSAHSADLSWIKDKLADLEDRSRRNNLKLGAYPNQFWLLNSLIYTTAESTSAERACAQPHYRPGAQNV